MSAAETVTTEVTDDSDAFEPTFRHLICAVCYPAPATAVYSICGVRKPDAVGRVHTTAPTCECVVCMALTVCPKCNMFIRQEPLW